ncbi:unnamed protein product [Protopolystoma xenopodis]|uniref:Uncharacterized protein n=1 Tax=Protopolystoma xenopodis TaxID=117903 RepID=A0A3S5AP90_9PLAT|nr:unnamed protein product [Protopolystoma xenopodis]
MSPQDRLARVSAIKEHLRIGYATADEKADFANKIYEVVDDHIRMFDNDFSRLQDDLMLPRTCIIIPTGCSQELKSTSSVVRPRIKVQFDSGLRRPRGRPPKDAALRIEMARGRKLRRAGQVIRAAHESLLKKACKTTDRGGKNITDKN